MKYFVWMRGLRGPEPQLWFGDDVGNNEKPLFKVKIDGGTIDEMVNLYPCPQVTE